MEVCNLKPQDIELGRRSGHLTVRADKRNVQRKIPLNIQCVVMLNQYLSDLATDPAYLFPSEDKRSFNGESIAAPD